MSCYTFKKISYDSGFMDDSVDATYVIHLEGNGRLESIHLQLEKKHPTKEVYILFNKGYKKCKKELSQQIPPIDLIDAFKQIFIHAKGQNYNNIIIFEDDFILNENIKDHETDEINLFINQQKNTSFIYVT